MQISNGRNALVSGTMCKNLDYGCVGKEQTPRCKFSVYLGKGEDGNGRYANCVAWRRLAEYASTAQDGDAVLVAGTISEHEYQGKTYKTLNADFLWILPAGGGLSGGFRETDEELPF